MKDHKEIIEAINSGKLEGFNSFPRIVSSLVADVFIFDSLGKALKLYKRDSQYFNNHVQDISHGESRIEFITKDYILDNKYCTGANMAANKNVKLKESGRPSEGPPRSSDAAATCSPTGRPTAAGWS